MSCLSSTPDSSDSSAFCLSLRRPRRPLTPPSWSVLPRFVSWLRYTCKKSLDADWGLDVLTSKVSLIPFYCRPSDFNDSSLQTWTREVPFVTNLKLRVIQSVRTICGARKTTVGSPWYRSRFSKSDPYSCFDFIYVRLFHTFGSEVIKAHYTIIRLTDDLVLRWDRLPPIILGLRDVTKWTLQDIRYYVIVCTPLCPFVLRINSFFILLSLSIRSQP